MLTQSVANGLLTREKIITSRFSKQMAQVQAKSLRRIAAVRRQIFKPGWKKPT